MFTPEEAEIAQHLEVFPLSLLEISKRLEKIEKKRKILDEMTDNGIIQDIAGYSYFFNHRPSFKPSDLKNSKALARLGRKGAELYQHFFVKEKFYKRYESSDAGTSLTRIVQ